MALAESIKRNGQIPEDAHGDPWFEDGNIYLVSDTQVFKYPRYLLVLRTPYLSEMLNLENLSDDIVDLVEDCPMFELPETANDLSSFLICIHDESELPETMNSLEDFHFLAGVVRTATRYKLPRLRHKALRVIESRYPSTLLDWDKLHHSGTKPWKPHSTLILNFAAETGVFSVVPSAIAELVDDVSASEVFGTWLDPEVLVHHREQKADVGEAALIGMAQNWFERMKEESHLEILKMLRFIRSVGADCTRPPEVIPHVTGKAPAGAAALKPQPALCRNLFPSITRHLLELVVLDRPMGYDAFLAEVAKVPQDRTKICKQCWKDFKSGQQKLRLEWWNKVPNIIGFEGWDDSRLVRVGDVVPEVEGQETL